MMAKMMLVTMAARQPPCSATSATTPAAAPTSVGIHRRPGRGARPRVLRMSSPRPGRLGVRQINTISMRARGISCGRPDSGSQL